MAGRASWSGYLKLSLVSCPVKLYTATSASAGKISFNLLHKDTLNRIQQKYHDPELGQVERTDLVKGYQFEKDKYVVVTQEEMDEIQVESSKTIDIDGFVDAGAIDPIYLDTPYYMAPEGPIAEETYAVVLEAMKRAKVVALARLVMSGRERLVAIHPLEGGFKVTTMRTAKEVKQPSTVFEKLHGKVTGDMLAMAAQIITKKKLKKFDAAEFEDRYENALMTLVQSKIKGGKPIITKVPERGNVVNLMDALRRSIEEERRPAAPSLGKEKKAARPAKSATKKKARA
ncbi:MAG: Ku protein [Proteobacteria bacterium]|nr:Ku protein [Pseudomonadota bacterium]